jgi:nitric oxide reductase subunit C
LTIDSHRRFPALTNEDKLTPEIIRGKDVWHKNNCINCHTLLGEGGYYAPDLTKITQQRGVPYLTAFLKDPSQFYSEEKHRRLMPNPNLSKEEISEVIAFLDWVSHIDGWVSHDLRIIDVEKEALLLVHHALTTLGDPFAFTHFPAKARKTSACGP